MPSPNLSPHTLVQARMMDALKQGNLLAVERALDSGAKVNAPLAINELVAMGDDPVTYVAYGREKTPLLVALEYQPDRPSLVRHLLDRGADPQAPDMSGRTPLSVALASNNLDGVRELLRAGVDVNRPNENGQTPLQQAVKTSPEATSLLLSHRANPLQPGQRGETALHDVAGNLDLSPGQRQRMLGWMLRTPVAAGAFATLKNADGRTPADLLAETDPQLLTEVNQSLTFQTIIGPAVPNLHNRAELQAALSAAVPQVVVRTSAPRAEGSSVESGDIERKVETSFNAGIFPAVRTSALRAEINGAESKPEMSFNAGIFPAVTPSAQIQEPSQPKGFSGRLGDRLLARQAARAESGVEMSPNAGIFPAVSSPSRPKGP